jgi:ferric-dicitrate binding protein FerR (iron transport regulator)
MMNDEDSTGAEEQVLGLLVRDAGPREQPAPAMTAAVRSAVEQEWRAVVAERRQRTARNWRPAALAASVAIAAVAAWVALPWLSGTGAPAAAIAIVAGPAELAGSPVMAANGAARPVFVGDTLVTGDEGRVALTIGDGVSIRVDENSEVQFESADRLFVRAGAVYLDAENTPAGAAGSSRMTRAAEDLEIASLQASARHLGTQYQFRVQPDATVISVREGRVLAHAAGGDIETAAGEQLALDEKGIIRHTAIAADDSAWDWIHAVTPAYSIDGKPLASYLAWVARESGRTLSYASAATRSQAADIRLSGSIAGLTPDASLEAVMATTSLRYTIDGSQLLIAQ